MISVRTKLYFSMENLILQQFFVFTFSERHDKMCSYLYFSFLRGQTMDSNFFALISRMRYIARWGLMRNALPENIQEHSHMVAVLAHALGVIRRDIFHQPCDVNALATAALYHDASEILTATCRRRSSITTRRSCRPTTRWRIWPCRSCSACCRRSCAGPMPMCSPRIRTATFTRS